MQSGCVLCSNGCGPDIAVKDGRMVGVRGRGEDRVNRGRLGPKGLFGWQANGSPDRLTQPLVRRPTAGGDASVADRRWRRGERERFTGWIAGLGTGSGHRVVVGHWHTSPYGPVTDVMVEDPAGHRTLYAPTPQLAQFVSAAYHFDEVQVAPCGARRSGARWTVRAGPLQLSFTVGRRSLLGWLLRALPSPLARTPWWASLQDHIARRLLPGVRTRGRTRDGRRQWYGARDLHPIIAATATLQDRDLGSLRAVHPPVGFGFGSVPHRPSLVQITTTIEAAGPGHGPAAA